MADANIRAVITADDRASGTLQGFGRKVNQIGKILAGAFVAKKVLDFGVSTVKAFQESENAVTQLNTVLKSTGGVAGVTSQAALDLANSLQKVTKFSDEEVLSAENLLLTFTKITKDVFPDATKIVLDMSAALGQDLKSSAIQVGKALQDPERGVTALRRVGVNFNSAQTEVIKKLVATGQAAKAQALIMKELRVEFGGSAVAAGTTFAGKLAILRNKFDEVKETMGNFLVNALIPLLNWLQGVGVHVVNGFRLAWQYLRGPVLALWATVQKNLLPSLLRLWNALKPLLPIIGVVLVGALIAAAIATRIVVRVLSTLINAGVRVIGVVRTVGGVVGSVFSNIWSFARRFIAPVAGIFLSIARAIANVISWLHRAAAAFRNSAIGKILGFIGGAGRAVGRFLTGRQSGGPIRAGQPYMVGEKGPEMVVPNQSGTVIPNHKLPSSGSAGNTHYHFHIGHLIANGVQERKFAERIVKNIQDIASMKGTTATSLLG